MENKIIITEEDIESINKLIAFFNKGVSGDNLPVKFQFRIIVDRLINAKYKTVDLSNNAILLIIDKLYEIIKEQD